MTKKKYWKPMPTIGRVPFSWDSQRIQYPPLGDPGISHTRYDEGAENHLKAIAPVPIECLFWRSEDGILRGVMNYYPVGVPDRPDLGFYHELPGHFMIYVEGSRQRQGIGTALLDEARTRWRIDFRNQVYTPLGALLVTKYLAKREIYIKG